MRVLFETIRGRDANRYCSITLLAGVADCTAEGPYNEGKSTGWTGGAGAASRELFRSEDGALG